MQQSKDGATTSRTIMIWDVPTRVFHWLMVFSFVGAYLTAESERYRDIHVVLGYTLLGLIVFRLLWGFFGTHYAQFRSFLFKPAKIVAYSLELLKGKPGQYLGHNPLGSVSIWLLLTLGIISGVSGVLLFEGIDGEILEELHEFASNAMLAVVLIHIAGVAASSVLHRENLVRAMVTGFKHLPEDSMHTRENQGIGRSHLWLGVIMLVAVVSFWVSSPVLLTPGMESTSAGHEDND